MKHTQPLYIAAFVIASMAAAFAWTAPVAPKISEGDERRTNAFEAARWYVEQRQPVGSNLFARGEPLPIEPYLAAMRQIKTLPHYSISKGRYEAPSQTRAAGPSASNTNLTQKWLNLGPGFRSSGRLRAIAIAPGGTPTTRTIYAAAASGGIFKSTDSGASWSAVGDALMNVLRIGSLVIDPNSDTTIYAGTGEGYSSQLAGNGIYKSTNAGASWTLLPSTTNTGDGDFRFVNKLIAVGGANPGIFAATSTGVHRSTNGGASWSRIFILPALDNLGCQDVSARSIDDLLAACQYNGAGHIVRSLNASDATAANVMFTEVIGAAPGFAAPNMRRAVIARGVSDPNTVYVSAARQDSHVDGIYKSTDNGAIWTAVVQTAAATDAVTDANGAFIVTGGVSAHGKILFDNVSDFCQNDGTTKASTTVASGTSAQGDYDQIIAVDPANAQRIFVGGIDQSRSNDGGKTWQYLTYWQGDPENARYGHADHHVIAFDPGYNGADNQLMYIGNDGGAQRTANAASGTGATLALRCAQSADPTIAWTNLTRGLVAAQFYDGQVDPISQSFVFGGTQDNGTPRSNDRAPGAVATGLSAVDGWNEINGGDGSFAAITSNGQTLFTATTMLSISKAANAPGLSFRDFAPATNGITDANNTFPFINPYVLDPAANSTNLWTSSKSKIWRTLNLGDDWTRASADLTACAGGAADAGDASAIAVNPRDSKHVLVGRNNGCVYRNLDALVTSNATVWNSTAASPGGNISSIAFDFANSANAANAVVYATVSTLGQPKVLRSADGGATWASINGNLPNVPANTLIVDGTKLYLGTDLGVFVSTDTGATWAAENDGLANVQVQRLQLVNTSGKTGANAVNGKNLYAFTYGRGAYRVQLDAPAGVPVVNGVCGAGNGVATATAPTALCNTGTASAVGGDNSNWTWSCNGSGGGANASCAASYAAQSISNFVSTPATLTAGGGNGTLSANSTGSTNPVTFSTASAAAICTLNGSTVTPAGQGTCTVKANKAGVTTGANRFHAAQQVARDIPVGAAAAPPPAITPPSAPRSLSATAGDGQVTVSFLAPSSTGGAAITNYQFSTNGGARFTAFNPAVTNSPVVIGNLVNGTQVTIQLRALNSAGNGAGSASVTATPVAEPVGGGDADQVPAATEDAVPNRTRPGTGDGNGDGIADSAQNHVTSLRTAAGGGFVTVVSQSGKALSTVTTAPMPDDFPAGSPAPLSGVGFTILNAGDTETVELYFPVEAGIVGLMKRNLITGNFDTLDATVTTTGSKTRVVFTLQNGGPYDADGADDATIVDPVFPIAAVGGASRSGGALNPALLLMLGLLAALRRRVQR